MSLGVGGQLSAEEPMPEQNFPLGERLVYKITWLRIPVGMGEIWTKEKTTLGGREVFHIVGKVKSNKVLSKIFPMNDEIHGWIDAKTFEALQFEKKIDELFINTHEKMVYDAPKKKGYFESFKTGKKNEFALQSPVHDFISVFYWVRRQNLAPGSSAKIVLTCDQKDWVLTVHGLGKEILKHDGKKIETLRIEPITFVDEVEKRDRAWINLTDDSLRKPIRIVFKASFGYVVGTLQNKKGSCLADRSCLLRKAKISR